ncbi:MAG: FeS-binding protein [candidate division WOR-3 bacterium]|nr:FeS-binding protein [candidate division WOR-3 bacterium]
MKSDMRTLELKQQLHQAGFKNSVISTDHLPELQSEYGRLLDDGDLDRDFYDEIVRRYGLNWDFEPPGKLPKARSIIITAAQQPKISMEFQYKGRKFYGIIPPTYVYDTDATVLGVISAYLNDHKYKVCDALLPTKMIAVRSGLARYGRNNITYIDGWGSYYRLKAYFSDMPCDVDSWQESVAMEQCRKCTACVTKCPTSAIGKDRFLIDAGKCLTFFNEGVEEFPKWIDPAWHNCLIGCMICQDVCPANKEHVSWLMPGAEFSGEETNMILKGVSQDNLPAQTREKLQKVSMLDSYPLLKRNLRALAERESSGAS